LLPCLGVSPLRKRLVCSRGDRCGTLGRGHRLRRHHRPSEVRPTSAQASRAWRLCLERWVTAVGTSLGFRERRFARKPTSCGGSANLVGRVLFWTQKPKQVPETSNFEVDRGMVCLCLRSCRHQQLARWCHSPSDTWGTTLERTTTSSFYQTVSAFHLTMHVTWAGSFAAVPPGRHQGRRWWRISLLCFVFLAKRRTLTIKDTTHHSAWWAPRTKTCVYSMRQQLPQFIICQVSSNGSAGDSFCLWFSADTDTHARMITGQLVASADDPDGSTPLLHPVVTGETRGRGFRGKEFSKSLHGTWVYGRV